MILVKTQIFSKSQPSLLSLCKAKLVADYFDTWSTILLPSIKKHDNRFLYIDFFAGPGKV